MVVLLIFLVCTFGSLNVFSFYLFFERRLIPTLFLILGWGYQPERLQAGIYLLLAVPGHALLWLTLVKWKRNKKKSTRFEYV